MATRTWRVLRRAAFVALSVCALALVAIPASQAGTGTWTGSTPAGATINVIAAASNGSKVYIGTPNGLFSMAPGGSSWASANTGLPPGAYVNDLKIDSNNSTLYALANGTLYKTATTTISWTPYPTTGLPPLYPQNVFLDPTTSGSSAVVYLLGFSSSGSLFRSAAGGAWTNLSGTLPTNTVPNAGIVDAGAHTATTAQVLVGGFQAVFRSVNSGTSFSVTRSGVPFDLFVNAFDQTPASAATPAIYAATGGGGVYRSTNHGASWAADNGSGITSIPGSSTVSSVSVDPNHPLTIYAAVGSDVYKTTNGGTAWSKMDGSGGTALPASGNINQVLVNPSSTLPNNVYVGEGFFRSTNGGTSWSPVNAGLLQVGINAIAANPTSGGLVLAGGYQGDLYHSSNGTAAAPTYAASVTGAGSYVTINALVWRPGSSSVAYAGTGSGIFITTDGGVHWSSLPTSGVSFGDVLNIAIDPTGAKMFVVTSNAGVWFSSNATAATPTFTSKSSGLPLCPQTGGLAVNWSGTITAYVGTDSGIFRTTNGGTSWSKFNTGVSAFDVARVIVLDPTTPTTVFTGMAFDGVWRSVGGGSWTQIDNGLTDLTIEDMTIPVSGTIMVATTSDIFKSTNATAATPSWATFNTGLPSTSSGILTTSVSATKSGATISAHTGLNSAGIRDRNN